MSEVQVVDRSILARARGLVALMRPKQWIKNLFVLAPLVFTGEFMNAHAVQQVVCAMLLFCLASSAVYIVNDIHDVESDRRHPRKSRTRPLAAGIVTVPEALGLLLLLCGLLASALLLQSQVVLILLAYLALNLAYTFVLKHQPVIDIFVVALGFVLRVYAGGVALSVPISSWMFVTTLCLALYLAAVKRRQELAHAGTDGRRVLRKYSVSLVDRYAEMSATGALVFYSMFVMSTRPELVITVPLVLFGLFRYWYVVEQLEGGESPTDVLLADWQLLTTVALWSGACVWALWPQG
ncbi:decaprenyl-phosphate phosphoribosyltransferase [Caldimonas thermodepolymerans]|mgnify:CR=1 FL=1|uniref:decaprenyl-phosphate phosphoribosyltransferase n=1 Tax=Caldimonas thermodepolymerans TaxID=215580 RepID=UPI0024932A9A|nr:decaprenyl-phosphate phosphoribosyltransferase [Caldimonas thermodepolymerans]